MPAPHPRPHEAHPEPPPSHPCPAEVPVDEVDMELDEEDPDELKKDLEERLGIEIIRFEIGNVNFLRDVAKIIVYYKN